MNNFAKIEDVEKLWRSLTEDEKERAKNLLPIVEDSLRMEADKVGKNLDRMIEEKPYLENVATVETYVAQTRAVAEVTGDDGNNSLLKAVGK